MSIQGNIAAGCDQYVEPSKCVVNLQETVDRFTIQPTITKKKSFLLKNIYKLINWPYSTVLHYEILYNIFEMNYESTTTKYNANKS